MYNAHYIVYTVCMYCMHTQMVRGTGPNGEITAKDVEAAAAAGPSPVAAAPPPIVVPPGAAFVDIPLTGFRKACTARLLPDRSTRSFSWRTLGLGLRAELIVDKLVDNGYALCCLCRRSRSA